MSLFDAFKRVSKDELGCVEVQKLAHAFINSKLHPSIEAKFKAHVEKCEECKQFVDNLIETVKRLDSLLDDL